jgi:hypothetical protein
MRKEPRRENVVSHQNPRHSRGRTTEADWYDYPQYYDLSFRSETRLEADFIEAACRKYAAFPVRRLLEPACGSGRLIAELAARGYQLTGLDLSQPSLNYLRRRLARRKLSAQVFRADMADFQVDQPVDAAYCTFDGFRHLLSEEAARRHLAVRRGRPASGRNLHPGFSSAAAGCRRGLYGTVVRTAWPNASHGDVACPGDRSSPSLGTRCASVCWCAAVSGRCGCDTTFRYGCTPPANSAGCWTACLRWNCATSTTSGTRSIIR